MNAPSSQILPEAVANAHQAHLQWLEAESIHIMREVVAEFQRPVLLFSGGKDSICLLRLAEKAFHPMIPESVIINRIQTAYCW